MKNIINIPIYKRWLKENLFSTISSSFLTIISFISISIFLRSIFGFLISPEREWTAVTYNLQLYMVQAYPESDFLRVWLSVGLIVSLAGFTAGQNNKENMKNATQINSSISKICFSIIYITIITPSSKIIDGVNVVLINFSTKLNIILGLFAILLISNILKNYLINKTLESYKLNFIYLSFCIAMLWVIKVPTVSFNPDGSRVEPDPFLHLAISTKLPWSIMYILLVFTFIIGKRISEKRFLKSTTFAWVFSVLIIFSWIYRKPDVEINKLFTNDLPIIVAFIILGYLIININNISYFNKFKSKITNALFIISVLFLFLPFISIIKILFFSLWLLSVIAKSADKDYKTGLKILTIWIIYLVSFVLIIRGFSSETLIEVPGSSIFGGFTLTWVLAIFGISISFPFGILLALGRTSTLPIIRIICTAVIELVRSVPFITWLFFGSVMLSLFLPAGVEFDEVVRAIVVTAIFSASYLAENIRGGLQSINKGQFEAADSVGLNTFQRVVLIILPQALRAVIPPIVSQVISLFKDTSLVAIVGLFDLLYIGTKVIPNQSQGANFIGTIQENILFCAFFYWIFTYSFAKRSAKLEKQLGLGER